MGNTPSLIDAIYNNDLLTVNSLIQSGTCDVNIQNFFTYLTPLHTAILYNIDNTRIEIIKCLLDCANCDVNIQDRDGYTPLHLAVKEGNIAIVQYILDRTDCDVNIRDREGFAPLHIAVGVWFKKMEIVRCLLDHSTINVNIQNNNGFAPLHTAVGRENIELVICLIDHTDCNINIQDKYGTIPLNIAVGRGDMEIVKCILDQPNSDVNIQDSDGVTALRIAVYRKDIEMLRCILDRPECDVNIKDNRGDTTLYRAIEESTIEIVRCLLEQTDCDVNTQGRVGDTPLHTAVEWRSIERIRCLLDRTDCDVNIQNIRMETPLHKAVQENRYKEMLRCLIDQTECDVNMQDSDGFTPLYTIVEKGNIDIVRYLLDRTECDVHIKNQMGYSPFSTITGLAILHKIAKHQNVELVQVLIQRKVNALNNHADNHLQLVEFILSENDFQSLWFLIENGLYINSLTPSGENIVHLLAKFYMDYLYIDVSFLFDYGLDFNLMNNDGNSPIMVASLLNNSPFIEYLAALPCDVNRQNHQGHTPLHLCVIGFTLIKEKLNMMKVNSVVKELCAREYYPRYLACIDTLINLGADVNRQDNGGKTVLMLACMKNDRKLLETLLISGADVNIVDNHGRSALQYIDLTNNVYDLTCFNLLLSYGCRQSFNQPYLNGNTIIQNVLQFTPLWEIDDIVNVIKFLVFKNVNLQLLTSEDGENSYGPLSMEEFSSESRHQLRQILYLSGGSFEQITKILHFEVEEIYEASMPEFLREKPREQFYLFANNLSLKKHCRRVIRQNTGLAIHNRLLELFDFPDLTDFLMFKDIDSERLLLPMQLKSFIDDDYDDDYNSYDLNIENDDTDDYDDSVYTCVRYLFKLSFIDDDYRNDYLMYKDCEYANEVHAGLRYCDSSPSLESKLAKCKNLKYCDFDSGSWDK